MRRSEKSVKNSLFAIFGQATALIFGFVTRIWFIKILGEDYLGVNGVFCSVLSLLSLTELGLGSVLTYALYQPIADRDEEKIGRIMNLYSRAYRIVAAAVFVLGLCLIPFLGKITADVPKVEGIVPIYLLFLVNSSASYFFSSKRALITASEQDWRNTLNTTLFSIIQNIVQLAFIILTGNYILYLVAQLVCTVLSNIEISLAADRRFPFLKQIKGMPEKEDMAVIKKNVGAMFVNRFGSVAVTGTDNLLIASIDVVLVGIYSNYLLLLQTVQVILNQVMTAVTASVGSLLTENNKVRNRDVYRDIIFAVCWLYGFSAIALDLLMTRFVLFFFGSGMDIAQNAVHLMALNFYLSGIRQPNLMYINAAGIFRPIRFKGFVEAAINLGVSALFLMGGMGLCGVLLGTTISHIATSLWWEPYCVSKYCLGKGSMARYAVYNLVYGFVGVSVLSVCGFATRYIPYSFGGFVASAAIAAVVPNLVFAVIYCKTPSFAFFTDIIKAQLKRFRHCK